MGVMETKLEIIELFMVQGQGLEVMENHGEENGQATESGSISGGCIQARKTLKLADHNLYPPVDTYRPQLTHI